MQSGGNTIILSAWPEFVQPGWLLLLPGVVPLLIWWLRRKGPALWYADVATAASVNTRRGTATRLVGAFGRGLALAALLVALAGPRWPDPGSRLPTEGIAIFLVVDVSNSMNEEDFMWKEKPIPRILAMKKALGLFIVGGKGPDGEDLPGRPQDLIGLVTFTKLPKSSCPLTLSHDALLQILESEETGKRGHDFETNIGDALAMALHRLESAPVKQKAIVLVSDGEQGEIPDALRPRVAAQLAGHFGVPVFIVDAGKDGAAPPKTPAEKFSAQNRILAKKTLQDVAKITSGQYYAATDAKALFEACVQLGAELDRFEPERIESFAYSRYWEGYAWFGGAAFMIWSVLLALELTVWRRLP
jgi:Ca-activated chloride channel family protein